MTTFKRYEMISVTRCGEGWQELQEEPEGDWMRYEDCESLTRQNEALRDALTTLLKRRDDLCESNADGEDLRWWIFKDRPLEWEKSRAALEAK